MQENENGNNTTPQNIDDSTNWYTFFNQLIGDGAFGGSISSGTPYAQIQGSGDGSFDLYSFTVTQDMLNPTGSTISPTSTAAAGPFYTSVGLKLNGTVSAGDTWSLGVGNMATISYVAQPGDGLLQVAQHLASQLHSPYSTCVANAGTSSCSGYSTDSVLLVISNSAGFSLNGATLNGITQQTQGANTVTRSTSVNQASGTAASLVAATISLDGTATPGDVWTLTVGGFAAQHIFGSSDSPHAMAVDLATQVNTHFGTTVLTADATLAKLTLSSAGGMTLSLSIRGAAPTGSMTVSGAVPVAGQVGTTPWTSETISIANGNVRTGETWHTTLTDLGPVQATVVTGGSASALATLLSTAISGHNGYSTSIDTTVTGFAKLTISRSTPFTLTPVSIDHAGTMTVSNGTYDTHVVTIDAVSGETGTWTLTLSEPGGGTTIATATSSNGPGSIASDLATQLGSDFEVTAAATGDVLTITRIDAAATDFDVDVQFAPDSSAGVASTTVNVVTIPTFTVGDTFTITVGSSANHFTSANTDATPGSVATDLGTQVSALSGYTVLVSGTTITIVSLSGAAFAVTLKTTTGGGTPTTTDLTSTAVDATQSAAIYTLVGPAVAGETWSTDSASILLTGSQGISDGPVVSLDPHGPRIPRRQPDHGRLVVVLVRAVREPHDPRRLEHVGPHDHADRDPRRAGELGRHLHARGQRRRDAGLRDGRDE